MRAFQNARKAAETVPSEQAPKPGAQVILIPMSLRALWMDILALDKRVDNASFRFAAIVGAHFNRKSGSAFLTLETIARSMGMSERTVYECAKKLEALGYLIVKRREFGAITRKTARGEFQVRTAGGKGVANTYLPALDGSQVAATSGGQNLEKRRDLLLKLSTEKPEPKVAMDCDHSEPKVAVDCDHSDGQRSQNSTSKVAAHCDPTLTVFPSGKQNTSRAREPSGADALGPLGAIIRHEIGEDYFHSWFRFAKIVSDTPECLTISMPTRFVISWVQNRWGHKLLGWMRLASKANARVHLTLEERGICASREQEA
jgi:DnaA N-terminal domain/Helix-turn-helix domain